MQAQQMAALKICAPPASVIGNRKVAASLVRASSTNRRKLGGLPAGTTKAQSFGCRAFCGEIISGEDN
tara:strand:- start:4513 stop:4716 length:204 start_codon:yes stop_codon:yes gene_type:complete